MISAQDIAQVVEQYFAGSDGFLVDARVEAGNAIEVVADRPAGLAVEECAAISRAVEAALNREEEDFSLTVASPGLGAPLRVLPQYLKLLGREVEVLLGSGEKLTATLCEASEGHIAVEYTALEPVEGKKRRQPVRRARQLPLSECTWVKACVRW